MVLQAFDPTLGRQRQVNPFTFKASLAYVANSTRPSSSQYYTGKPCLKTSEKKKSSTSEPPGSRLTKPNRWLFWFCSFDLFSEASSESISTTYKSFCKFDLLLGRRGKCGTPKSSSLGMNWRGSLPLPGVLDNSVSTAYCSLSIFTSLFDLQVSI